MVAKKTVKKDVPEVDEAPVEKPLDEFQKALQGLRNRVMDMQLRPAERASFEEDLDRLEKLR